MGFSIENLFDGISPLEDINPKSKKYVDTRSKIKVCRSRIMEDHPEIDPHVFLELENLNHDSESIYGTECYVHGFRMGAMLMLEILKED